MLLDIVYTIAVKVIAKIVMIVRINLLIISIGI